MDISMISSAASNFTQVSSQNNVQSSSFNESLVLRQVLQIQVQIEDIRKSGLPEDTKEEIIKTLNKKLEQIRNKNIEDQDKRVNNLSDAKNNNQNKEALSYFTTEVKKMMKNIKQKEENNEDKEPNPESDGESKTSEATENIDDDTKYDLNLYKMVGKAKINLLI